MIYLEMSRDESHGGGTWAFPNCIWAPTKTRAGRPWPYWTKVLEVNDGDIVIHLRGVRPWAKFVGYSAVTGSGFVTKHRPPVPGQWDFADSFARANLSDFVSFHQEIDLDDVFNEQKAILEDYFDRNKALRASKLNIFYVKQSGRLQCLNGAYLSEVDDELLRLLFEHEGTTVIHGAEARIVSVKTGSQVSTIKSRIGQSKFASEIKDAYSNICCFPGCSISDPRFLVASHIARWADNEELRGHLGNGLCFCLMHDKAFELGLFTLNEEFEIYVSRKEQRGVSSFLDELLSFDGEKINFSSFLPLKVALSEHQNRVGIEL